MEVCIFKKLECLHRDHITEKVTLLGIGNEPWQGNMCRGHERVPPVLVLR